MLLSWPLGRDAELVHSSVQQDDLQTEDFSILSRYYSGRKAGAAAQRSGSGTDQFPFCKMIFWVCCCPLAFSALRARASASLLYFSLQLPSRHWESVNKIPVHMLFSRLNQPLQSLNCSLYESSPVQSVFCRD